MSGLKKIFISISFLAVIFAPAATLAASDPLFGVCDINQQTAKSPLCPNPNPKENPVVHVIHVATDIIALLTGIAAVILIIVSGLTFITSAGNQEAVANSRKRITAAVIGLVIVALAWLIVSFVTDKIIQ